MRNGNAWTRDQEVIVSLSGTSAKSLIMPSREDSGGVHWHGCTPFQSMQP